ncbi:MAG: hypothetical protein AAFR31_01400 [Cyanobacteria bacterium J06627_8]
MTIRPKFHSEFEKVEQREVDLAVFRRAKTNHSLTLQSRPQRSTSGLAKYSSLSSNIRSLSAIEPLSIEPMRSGIQANSFGGSALTSPQHTNRSNQKENSTSVNGITVLPSKSPSVPVRKQKWKMRPLVSSVGVLKWGTMTVTSALFIAMFAVYGWTVSLEQRGAALYEELTELREAEKGMRNMTKGLAMEAAAKNANDQYLPGRGSILSLTAAPLRPSVPDPEDVHPSQPQRIEHPRGY